MISRNRSIVLVQSLCLFAAGVTVLFLFGLVGVVMAQSDPSVPSDVQNPPSPTMPGAVLSSDGFRTTSKSLHHKS